MLPQIRRADPIFILGIMPRSGTNYIWDLLRLHPDCAPARTPIMEDFFLEHSDHLLTYTQAVRDWWDPIWGDFPDDLIDRFRESLGDGLISFLWVDGERRLLTKSPSVRHVDRFFAFFPRARLLILVRDGRSVVQSAMATFGWDFDRAARNWATAADEIRSFEANSGHEQKDRYLLVRYEDLVDDVVGSLTHVLRFLELKETVYDFDAAARLPVRGSSVEFGPGRQSVHWEPVDKRSEFDPKERWRSWSPAKHERFEWIAGEQLRYFGYQSLAEPVRTPRTRLRHQILDWKWQTRTRTRSVIYRTRVKLGTASRPLRQRLGLVRSEP